MSIELYVLPGTYAIFKASAIDQVNQKMYQSSLYIISESKDEVSVICEENLIPDNNIEISRGWKLIKFTGSVNDALVGIVGRIAKPLADSGISLIVHTTYDAGYFGVSKKDLKNATNVLSKNNFVLKVL